MSAVRSKPGGGAFALAQAAVQGDEARVHEALAHLLFELRREPDFGNQE